VYLKNARTLDRWDVSKVINFKYMFKGATAFNQPLNKPHVGVCDGIEVSREVLG
jgi:hypothetical protein